MSIAETVRLQQLETLVIELRKRLEALEKRPQRAAKKNQPRIH